MIARIVSAIAGLLAWHSALAVGPAASRPPRWRVQQEEIGPRQAADEQRAMSADGRRYAYVKALEGGQYAVVVDGKAGPAFKDIREESLTFSADGKRFAYVGIRPEDRAVAVVDGAASTEHDNIGALSFSADGKHAAYLACDHDRWVPVVDGKVLPLSRQHVTDDSLQLSRDGSGILFFGGGADDRWTVVWNRRTIGAYDDVLGGSALLSRDGRSVIFGVQIGSDWAMVVNGQPGPRFEGVGRPSAGPGEAHWVYVGKKAGKSHVVIDGKVGPPFDELAWVRFSDDGRHVLYAARDAKRWTAVVDGVPGPQFDELAAYRLAPDKFHVVSVARDGKTWRSVVDGKVVQSWEASPDFVVCEESCRSRSREMVFALSKTEAGGTRDAVVVSRDGRHLARTVKKGDRYQVALDGVVSPEYLDLDPTSLNFSKDGTHLAYKAHGPSGWMVIVDGEAGPAMQSVEPAAFRGDGSLTYFAEDGQSLFRIRHLPAEPKATR